MRKRARRSYREMTDSEWYTAMEKAEREQVVSPISEFHSPSPQSGRRLSVDCGELMVGNFSGSHNLQNMIMQLRKAANHPYLFDWPVVPGTDTYLVDDNITTSSGKMLLLSRLLPPLFAENHKVLLFSQFTTMLDIISDWATELHSYPICRIDGSVPQCVRKQEIELFNTSPEHKLFLLSTRAGGLGINLTAADTVIIFDSDWNPQQDLQAQDRAHRIGQTRPVIVYRFVSANTVESQILTKAASKRKLEKLVIQKGKFRSLAQAAHGGDTELGELAELLTREEGEKVLPREGEGVLSEEELREVLDRGDEAYERAEKGKRRGRVEVVEDKSGEDEFATRV
jgi:ATP-dependent DNA helicase